jgi:hypothetical protein
LVTICVTVNAGERNPPSAARYFNVRQRVLDERELGDPLFILFFAPRRTKNGAGRFEMRFNQIIAAVARSLKIEGVREISSVDAFAHASGLQLCMACVSPGMDRYPGPQPRLMFNQSSWGHRNQLTSHAWLSKVACTALGKRKRLPLTARLIGLAKRGSASLTNRDC